MKGTNLFCKGQTWTSKKYRAGYDQIDWNATTTHTCTGYRYPETCPTNGKFDALNRACEDCMQGAQKAMASSILWDREGDQ